MKNTSKSTNQWAEKFLYFKTQRYIYVYIYTIYFTYLLTPWCRVLLEKLTGLQLVKKFPAFHGTRRIHYRTHKRPPPVPILGQPKLSVASVRTRTIPTERPPPVGEVSANFCG